jgi:hypothetical protein
MRNPGILAPHLGPEGDNWLCFHGPDIRVFFHNPFIASRLHQFGPAPNWLCFFILLLATEVTEDSEISPASRYTLYAIRSFLLSPGFCILLFLNSQF